MVIAVSTFASTTNSGTALTSATMAASVAVATIIPICSIPICTTAAAAVAVGVTTGNKATAILSLVSRVCLLSLDFILGFASCAGDSTTSTCFILSFSVITAC